MAHFKGLFKIVFYTKVFLIANMKVTIIYMKTLLGTQICMLFLRDFGISGSL